MGQERSERGGVSVCVITIERYTLPCVVRDFAVVSFVSLVSFVFFVSCYFGSRETRETIGTRARTGISLRYHYRALHTAVRCPRLRCRLSCLFHLSCLFRLLLFWDERDKRDDRDQSEDGYQSALSLSSATHCRALSATSLSSLSSLSSLLSLFVSLVSKKYQLAPRPNFLSEWCRCGDDTRKPGWDILDVFPIRAFD